MKRTQIQLEEGVFDALRQRAFATHTSIAEQIRKALRAYLAPQKDSMRKQKKFSFIGAGSSRGKGSGRIYERHDEHKCT